MFLVFGAACEYRRLYSKATIKAQFLKNGDTVEPLLNGHLGDLTKCLLQRGGRGLFRTDNRDSVLLRREEDARLFRLFHRLS